MLLLLFSLLLRFALYLSIEVSWSARTQLPICPPRPHQPLLHLDPHIMRIYHIVSLHALTLRSLIESDAARRGRPPGQAAAETRRRREAGTAHVAEDGGLHRCHPLGTSVSDGW